MTSEQISWLDKLVEEKGKVGAMTVSFKLLNKQKRISLEQYLEIVKYLYPKKDSVLGTAIELFGEDDS